jgi:hypothetical protein
MANKQLDELNEEWIQLLKELMESKVSNKDFRAFIESKKIEKENKKKF